LSVFDSGNRTAKLRNVVPSNVRKLSLVSESEQVISGKKGSHPEEVFPKKFGKFPDVFPSPKKVPQGPKQKIPGSFRGF
jgi:hypothetical protein